jgi:MFS family permease
VKVRLHRAEILTINPTLSGQQSARFINLYALAVAGGASAYIPFLTILLPFRTAELSGENALTVLAIAAFAGAISASISNIGFGWASDISGKRRPWIFAGLILSSSMLIAMPLATNSAALIAMIVIWQIFLNMMLAPLTAWAGDCVPDAQKGTLGGLLAAAPAVGAMSGALVTYNGYIPVNNRELCVAILVAAMVAPVLLFGRPKPMQHLMQHVSVEDQAQDQAASSRLTIIRMWSARLLIQIAEASLFAFLLLWFRSLDPAFGDNDAASIFAIVLGLAVFLALAIGRWSDRAGRPITPLIWSSGIAAAGLFIMSIAPGLTYAITGYILFGLASSVFLALHSSQTLRVLPRPQTRGRDLGFFNLTNTVPSLIMPWLTLALVPAYGFDALFLLLACLAAAAWFLLLRMKT